MEAFIIMTVLIIVVLGIGGLLAKRFFGYSCYECGSKLQPYEKLSDDDKADILAYFRRFENREPDVEYISVCGNCRLVSGDFSRWYCKVCDSAGLEYIGAMVAPGELVKYQERNKNLIEQIECLRCKRNPSGHMDCIPCDTEIKIKACRRCYSLYAQMPVNGSRYRFQVLLSDREIIKDSSDSKWSVFEPE
ncbi:MAG: hypothetical protein F4Z86_10385 [Gemmatimonadetes bacterium]|nr:hypothetical protein [Gemmatimonadota bacterium]MYB54875.1 hypothetical protein [Gemmatimonadota bacterium]MYD59945.1 hypothetical protein [Gemmatimonadota bacterium]